MKRLIPYYSYHFNLWWGFAFKTKIRVGHAKSDQAAAELNSTREKIKDLASWEKNQISLKEF